MREEYIFNSINEKKVIFDVETTGLDVDDNYIAQLSYIIVGSDIEVVKNFFFTVPKMEKEAEEVHKLSQNKLKVLSNGKNFNHYADEILMDFKHCSLCIGHNVNFDLRFLEKEFERLNIKISYLKEKVECTMHEYTNILKLNSKSYKGYKWPKLEEVIEFLNLDRERLINETKDIFCIDVDEECMGFHDSRVDVICTYQIYIIREGQYKKLNSIDRNIVILDIETTGDNHHIDEICQMSYIILNEKLTVIKSRNYFFKVDYVYFKSNKNKLNKAELKKLSGNSNFKDYYNEIFKDLNGNLIVCHNCEHDLNFLKTEFMRINNKNDFKCEVFCTMEYYKDILKIPNENYIYKYPKLVEIMPYLNIKRNDIIDNSISIFELKEEDVEFHDSRVDAVATYLVAIKTPELINVYKKLKSEDLYNNKINSENFTRDVIKKDFKEKKSLNIKKEYKVKTNKKDRFLKILGIIICLLFIVHIYLEDKNNEKIINTVSNYQYDSFGVNEIIEFTVNDTMISYGWNIEKVKSDTYFVYYEFDNDDNIDNGTHILAYEYYKPTNQVNIISGELAEEYISLGYLNESDAMLVNGIQVFNTTYYTYDDRELRCDDYTIDKKLAKDNLKINRMLYGNFESYFYNKESYITGGRARETVFVIKGENTFHRSIDCSELEDDSIVYRVFHRKAEVENRVLCDHEIE